MTPGKMSGLLLPEPAHAATGISIDARSKMTPALQAPVYVLTPRVLRWRERDQSEPSLLLLQRVLLSVNAEGGMHAFLSLVVAMGYDCALSIYVSLF
jgi:hypothetical protein